jgi:hypothetical protein
VLPAAGPPGSPAWCDPELRSGSGRARPAASGEAGTAEPRGRIGVTRWALRLGRSTPPRGSLVKTAERGWRGQNERRRRPLLIPTRDATSEKLGPGKLFWAGRTFGFRRGLEPVRRRWDAAPRRDAGSGAASSGELGGAGWTCEVSPRCLRAATCASIISTIALSVRSFGAWWGGGDP